MASHENENYFHQVHHHERRAPLHPLIGFMLIFCGSLFAAIVALGWEHPLRAWVVGALLLMCAYGYFGVYPTDTEAL